MPILIRPTGDPDLGNASVHEENTLPMTIEGLAPGDWDVGRVVWAPDTVSVQDTAPPQEGTLLIAGGQSNAEAHASRGEATPADLTSLANVFILVGGAWEAYQPGVNSNPGGASPDWGPEAYFARDFRARYPARPLYIVKRAFAWAPLMEIGAEDWSPTSSGESFEALRDDVTAAKALLAGASVPFDTVSLWTHGETDTRDQARFDGYYGTDGSDGSWAAFFSGYRAQIDDGLFINTRLRPYTGRDSTSWAIGAREMHEAQADQQPEFVNIDADFVPGNFADIHPPLGWVEGLGQRALARYAGSYGADFGELDDQTPEGLALTNVTDADPDTVYVAATGQITGLNRGAPVSVSAGEFRIVSILDEPGLAPGGVPSSPATIYRDWGSAPATVHPYQRVELRMTSSSQSGQAVTADLTVGTATASWRVTTAATPTGVVVQPVVLLGDSNVAGGDDSVGASLNAASIENPALRVFNVNNGAIEAPSVAGIPRPAGLSSTSTNAFFEFAGTLAQSNPDTVYLGVFTAIGGTGLQAGNGSAQGPWSPDGTAPAWTIGGSVSASTAPGAMYEAHASGGLRQAMLDAIAADPGLSGATVADPIFMGHIVSANDISAPLHSLLDRAARAVDGVRAGWQAPGAPWIMWGAPPEWTHSGARGREGIAFANAWLAQSKPGVAFINTVHGHRHPAEEIHFNNAGLDAIGTQAATTLLGVAEARSAAPFEWVDRIEGSLDRVYGLVRLVAGYTGPAFRITNGSAETDIGFTADGLPDYAAMHAHAQAAGGDLSLVSAYDQAGSGSTADALGTGLLRIGFVDGTNTQFLFQGLRPAWGDDSLEAIMLTDGTTGLGAGGALMGIGRIAAAGRAVMVAGPNGTFAHYTNGGATVFQSPGGANTSDTPQGFEPAWLEALPGTATGVNLYANLVTPTPNYYQNGAATTFLAGGGSNVTSAGHLTIGGEQDTLSDLGRGSYVAAVSWVAEPVGAALTSANLLAEAITRIDDVS